MKTTSLLSAGALLGTYILATPVPQESDPPPDDGSENFQVLPYQEVQASTIIPTSQGGVTIESRLYEFRGCGDKKDNITQAFVDAIKIANAVGDWWKIIGYTAGEPEDKPQEVYDYFGPKENWRSNYALTYLPGNFQRAQVGGSEGWLGDWWNDRYYQIVCDDPLARCGTADLEGVRAYEDDPGTKENDGKYARINLCPKFFTNLENLSDRIAKIRSGEHASDYVENLRSRGSALLHELFHTVSKNLARRTDPGISYPKAVDHKPFEEGNRAREKAYGAHRAKYLAHMKKPEKQKLAFTNVDNYVYFALSRLMMKEFNVPYPEKPPAAWSDIAIEGEEQELAIDGDANAVTADFTTTEELLSDEELYASPGTPQPSATGAPPPPAPTEEIVCYDPGKGSSNPSSCYIARDAMMSHAAAFCEEVNGLETAKLSKGYAQDTYSGANLLIDSDKKISKDECVTRFTRFIDGCVPNANNPMNWKYGGELRVDGTYYKINVDGGRSCKRQVNEGDAPLQSITAKCDSFYQFVKDEFWIYGAGFLDGNFGKPLFDQMSSCIGSSVTDWSFEYYESPDSGMEWKAFGHTPVFQKNCFSPVIKGSGGPDIPCNGGG